MKRFQRKDFLLSSLVIMMLSGFFFPIQSPAADPLDTWFWRNPLPQGNTLNKGTYGNGLFVAVGQGGTILTSTDGSTWTARMSGTSIDLMAITYGNGIFITVGAKGVMLTSTDGVTWTFRNSGTAQDLYSIVYGNGIFIVGSTSIVLTSLDGVTWTVRSTGTIWPVTGITYGNGVFVGVTFENIVITSSDGIAWTIRNTPPCWEFGGVAFGGGLFVAVGNYDGTIITSLDGVEWTAQTSGTDQGLPGVTYANGSFIAVGGDGVILKSSDGVNWSAQASGTQNTLAGIVYGNGTMVAVGEGGTILTSNNGESWTNHSSGFYSSLNDIIYNNSQFLTVGANGTILSSLDGISWTSRNPGTSAEIYKITYGNGQYVAVGGGSNNGWYSVSLTSTDGLSWKTQEIPVSKATLNSVAYGNGKFVAVGGGYDNGSFRVILTSSDGVAWIRQTVVTPDWLNDIVFANGIFVAVGGSGSIVTSGDGVTWTSRTAGTAASLYTISYGNGKFIAAGWSAALTSADGVSWSSNTLDYYVSRSKTIYAAGSFVRTGSAGRIYSSSDGISWTTRYVGSNNNLYGITYNNGNFFIVGSGGLIKSGSSLAQLPLLYKLTVDKSGSGTGTIGSTSADINCGSTCSATLPVGTQVTLVATPGATSDFGGWSGSCSGSFLACNVAVDAAKSVTAIFLPQAGFEEIKYDDNGLELNASPWSNSPGSEIAVRFTPQTYPVTLKAVKFFVPRYRDTNTLFEVRIYAANNGNYPGTRLNRNTITAAATTGNEWVTVDVSEENIQIIDGDYFVSMYWLTAPSSTGQYAQYLGIDKTAPVSERTCWKGGASGIWMYWPSDDIAYGNAMIRTMVAKSAGLPLLTIIKNGTGTGTVTSVPMGISCGSDCSKNFSPDITVTLLASANPGSSFVGWSGSGCTGRDSCTVSMGLSKTVNALFEQQVFGIVSKEATNGIIIPSGTVTVPYGADQTFTITPNGNCQIADVLVDGVSVGIRTTYTFKSVDTSHTISAVFAGDKQVRGVTVAGTQTNMTIGSTLDLMVVASFSDQSIGVISDQLLWSSLKPSVATVTSDGRVTAIGEGVVSIIAIYQGIIGKLNITVGPSVPVEKQHYGNLIIVAGGGVALTNTLKNATQNLCYQVYRRFKARGFKDDDIYYFNPMTWHDIDGDGVEDNIVDDSTPSLDKFGQSVTQWAANRNTDGPLFIYLNDHGESSTFLIAPPDVYLRAAQLKAYLDSFQQQTGRQVIVIIEACYSGSFTNTLVNTSYDRIVVTSSSASSASYMASNGDISFSQFLMQSLWQGDDLYHAWIKTKQHLSNIGEPISLMEPQLAESKSLSSSQVKVGGDFVIAGLFPEFLEQSPQMAVVKGTSHTFYAKLASMEGIESVWAVVLSPDYVVPDSNGYFDPPIVNMPIFNLTDADNDGKFEGRFDQFNTVGDYRITFYARNRNKNISISVPIMVTVREKTVALGDVDSNDVVEISDAILSLQTISGLSTADKNVALDADVNSDGKIGLTEAIYILQKAAGVR